MERLFRTLLHGIKTPPQTRILRHISDMPRGGRCGRRRAEGIVLPVSPVLPISNFNSQLGIGNNGTGNIHTLATLPSPPSRAAASASLGVFASLWVANPRKGRIRKPSCFHESHDITSRATVSMLLYQRGPTLCPPQFQGHPTTEIPPRGGLLHCPKRVSPYRFGGNVVFARP